MTQNATNPDGLQVALLTVHVEQETVEQIRSMLPICPGRWLRWITRTTSRTAKLPALTQRAIEAQGCIAVVDFDRDPELALRDR